jgi:hypothetical protein
LLGTSECANEHHKADETQYHTECGDDEERKAAYGHFEYEFRTDEQKTYYANAGYKTSQTFAAENVNAIDGAEPKSLESAF